MMLTGPVATRGICFGSIWKVPRGTGSGKLSDWPESRWVTAYFCAARFGFRGGLSPDCSPTFAVFVASDESSPHPGSTKTAATAMAITAVLVRKYRGLLTTVLLSSRSVLRSNLTVTHIHPFADAGIDGRQTEQHELKQRIWHRQHNTGYWTEIEKSAMACRGTRCTVSVADAGHRPRPPARDPIRYRPGRG